jgi:hypothetical protein
MPSAYRIFAERVPAHPFVGIYLASRDIVPQFSRCVKCAGYVTEGAGFSAGSGGRIVEGGGRAALSTPCSWMHYTFPWRGSA